MCAVPWYWVAHSGTLAACRRCSLCGGVVVTCRLQSNNVPFICMDLCFISSLLVDGFGLSPETPLHLSKTMQFNDQKVETQWTLGAALYAMM
eukprot:m.1193744 g.1193744  ORF g.1193744 m.1193744 type:complete len:92 (-) comp24557_c0_seq49:4807-5082(-)